MATMKVRFLDDGSVKIEVDGEVPAEIHDAAEASIDALAAMLGGPVTREARPTEGHAHSHDHAHIHQGGGSGRGGHRH